MSLALVMPRVSSSCDLLTREASEQPVGEKYHSSIKLKVELF